MRRYLPVAVAAMVVGAGAAAAGQGAGGSSAAPAAVHRATLDTATGVQIINQYGGLCLDAEDDANGNPNDNGDKVQLWDCNGQANQHWIVNIPNTMSATGTVVNVASGKCLDAEDDANGNPNNNGDKVQLWTCNGSQNQQWFASDGDGFGNAYGLALDAEQDAKGNPTENGDKVQLWQSTGGLNQNFLY